MHVLLVKTSSLGDVLHALPAVTDAVRAMPGLRFDWLVEEACAAVPRWHPAVERVIPVALRRWRHAPLAAWRSGEWSAFRRALAGRSYGLVLDAQGLMKSAFLSCLARGPRAGFDAASAREPLAARCYAHRHAVPRDLHAVERLRRLFAAALGYAPPQTPVDYGIAPARSPVSSTIMLAHGTSWSSKRWPEAYWIDLTRRILADGHEVALIAGSEAEDATSRRIADAAPGARVLPRLDLDGLRVSLSSARGFIGVDSGVAHLGAAIGLATLTLYGPTDPARTGTTGPRQAHLAASFPCAPCLKRQCRYRGARPVDPPCFGALTGERVWATFRARFLS